ncbi:hypothetical protein LJR251_003457 [Rhizobium rhizogenes]|uniref:hypothetical protein n=1 Tax=Rhizobium rhizogenes TaxID=359 RepID=UPI003ECCBAE0
MQERPGWPSANQIPASAMQGLPLVRIPAKALTSAAGENIDTDREINHVPQRNQHYLETWLTRV